MERPFMPEIKILPSLRDIGHFLGRLLTPLPEEAPPHMSNHYRGASEMLDAMSPTINEPTDGEAYQPSLFTRGWDSEGCYIDRSRV